jgi:hypothetical protein
MAKKKRKVSDPVQARLDRMIGLLQDLVIIQGKRYGLGRSELLEIVRRDAKRVSKVTKNIIVPK